MESLCQEKQAGHGAQDFAEVMRKIVTFIGPVLEAQTGKLTWIPGEGWR
jgi:hypothetical protein